MERLILDTTVLVAAQRGGSPLAALVNDEDDLAVAAVTAAELLVGVELADARHRAGRAAFVEAVLAELRIEPYEVSTARAHAGLLATVRRQGRPRGAHDLIIAATALDTDRAVVTADATGFDGLPAVRLRAAG
ncbi:MAG: PIN domain-containing protein [Solirubrobacteraceae bacterium MAG38_C4-C5]|nr:PIN domain-containing protein [Candidatus Siliceabacter maunaloa]